MRARTALSLASIALAIAAARPASAWLLEGHRRVGVAAVEAAGPELPVFFRAGAATVGHVAIDPDLWKNQAMAELRASEEPSHYLDWERLPAAELPSTRTAFFAWLGALGLDLTDVGSLPYSVIEGTQRLTLCFAEHRRWPESPQIQSKCLVYAGWLAHYAADLAQPLHTTIHHDGWALPGGSSPLVGFHYRIDALLERSPYDPASALPGLAPAPFDELRAGVLAELAASHALVDRVYRLEPLLRAADGGWSDPEVVAFACDRFGAATLFLARLYETAWKMSAEVELRKGLVRETGALEPLAPRR